MPKHLLVPFTAALSLTACVALPPEDLVAASESTGTGDLAATPDDETFPAIMTTTEGEPRDETTTAPDEVGCEPGARETCPYGGPAWALGVGACAAATRDCGEDGRWSACEGQVVPRAEDCRSEADESCDGVAACDGELAWVRSFHEAPSSDPGDDAVHALTVDPAGRAWVTGQFDRSLRIGARLWQADGDGAYLLAQLGGDGEPTFSFGDAQEGALGHGVALARDHDGRLAVSAGHQGKLQVHPESPVYAASELNKAAVIGALDIFGGYQWSRALVPTDYGAVVVGALAFSGTGDLWAAGHFSYADLALETTGAPLLLNNLGGYDALLVKLYTDGAIAWAGRFGDASDQQIHDIAVDARGDVWIVGGFAGGMQFAGGALQAVPGEQAHQDMFVVKLDPAGAYLWGRAFGDADEQRFLRVEVDADGDGLLLGEYRGVLQGLTDKALISGSSTSLVAVKLDPDGDVAWARGWPCQGHCSLDEVALDAAGQTALAVTIEPESTLTVNAAPLVAGPDAAVGFVVKLDRAGYTLWSSGPLPPGPEVAVGPLGEVFIAGEFHEKAVFAGAHQLDAGEADRDIYVAKLRP